MIGVVVPTGDEVVVREFFELFKTPWGFVRPGGRCDVLLCTQSEIPEVAAALVLCFGCDERSVAVGGSPAILSQQSGARIRSPAGELPIYGGCLTFRGEAVAGLVELSRCEAVAVAGTANGADMIRLGFDLFGEVRHLLTAGQPAASAAIPALDLHIALLRQLITAAGVPLVEIPPVPAGHPFMVCLTHDVDHPILRNHRFDHTMAGFLYRATLGSLVAAARGRLDLRRLIRNWGAALSLPLIHCGLARDIWRDSLMAYAGLERGLGATFFILPFKGRPGRALKGNVWPRRAAPYEPSEIGDELRRLMASGCEVGVHGLDAWCDSASGCAERDRIAAVTGPGELGVRMHWLWFDEQSPAVLEEAGFSYDSTVGFNQTVGFRAGTTQAYRPLNATRLLELPLHVMDTALFYPSYLDLSPAEARSLVGALLDQAVTFGGAVTVNWHDRSIAPERLWDAFYLWLIRNLKERGAWFPTAGQAVAWFRQRRSVVFESVSWDAGSLKLRTSATPADGGPALRLRVHRPAGRGGAAGKFVDVPYQSGELAIAV